MAWALNNPRRLICNKIKKPNQTNHKAKFTLFIEWPLNIYFILITRYSLFNCLSINLSIIHFVYILQAILISINVFIYICNYINHLMSTCVYIQLSGYLLYNFQHTPWKKKQSYIYIFLTNLGLPPSDKRKYMKKIQDKALTASAWIWQSHQATTIWQSLVVSWDTAGALWVSGNDASKPCLNPESSSDKGFVRSNAVV